MLHNHGQLELARRQYEREVLNDYITILLNPESGPEHQRIFLRQILAMPEVDEAMRKWAQTELDRVEQTVAKIDRLQQQAEKQQDELNLLLQQGAGNQRKILDLQQNIHSLKRSAQQLRFPLAAPPPPSPPDSFSTCLALKGVGELAGWELGKTRDLKSCKALCHREDGCVAVLWEGKEYKVDQ